MRETRNFTLSLDRPLQDVLREQGEFVKSIRRVPTRLEVASEDVDRIQAALVVAPMPWLEIVVSKELTANSASLSTTDE